MKNLFKKISKNIKEKGWKKTGAIMFNLGKTALTSEQKKLRLLEKYIRQHNQAYEKITSLATELNNGVHPKHTIMDYGQFFLDQITPEDHILDAGSGTGLISYRLAQKAKRVLGVDNNEQSIKGAREKYQRANLKFELADLNQYQPETKFDKIVLSNVLEHIEQRVELLKNLGKMAETILLRVPLITRDWLAAYKKSKGFPYKLDPTHETEYTEEELKKELAEAGWTIMSGQTNWGEWWGVIKKYEKKS